MWRWQYSLKWWSKSRSRVAFHGNLMQLSQNIFVAVRLKDYLVDFDGTRLVWGKTCHQLSLDRNQQQKWLARIFFAIAPLTREKIGLHVFKAAVNRCKRNYLSVSTLKHGASSEVQLLTDPMGIKASRYCTSPSTLELLMSGFRHKEALHISLL